MTASDPKRIFGAARITALLVGSGLAAIEVDDMDRAGCSGFGLGWPDLRGIGDPTEQRACTGGVD